jgi:hypothetical protein
MAFVPCPMKSRSVGTAAIRKCLALRALLPTPSHLSVGSTRYSRDSQPCEDGNPRVELGERLQVLFRRYERKPGGLQNASECAGP